MRCPKCKSKNVFFDETQGPIVGGVIIPKVDKDGYLKYPRGSHNTGMWVCLDCGHMWYKQI